MGLTLPPIPPPPLLNTFQRGISIPGSRPKDGFYFDIMPPDWAEDIPDYHISSCWWKGAGACGAMVVMTYMADDICNCVRGFAKVYALVDVDPYEKTGKPFPQMKGIWKELCRHNKRGQYTISEDGRICNDIGDFPSENDVKAAIYDISSMYDSWVKFPEAPDWGVVQKLHEAQQAVDQMRVETKHGWMQKDIEDMRKKIKETQEEIARVERNLNEMYEKAADGMNILEQYGVKVDLDEEPAEPKEVPPEGDFTIGDFTIPDPSDVHLSFAGTATIMRNASGGCLVEMDNHAIPRIGDVVIDPPQRSSGRVFKGWGVGSCQQMTSLHMRFSVV